MNETTKKTMENVMKIYTIKTDRDGYSRMQEGALVESYTLKGTGTPIPVILVGESGYNCKVGVLPVRLTKAQYTEWQRNKSRPVPKPILVKYGSLGETESGKPKLIAEETAGTCEESLVVFRTSVSSVEGNDHTGPLCDEERLSNFFGDEGVPQLTRAPFPGEDLVYGKIAEGDVKNGVGFGFQLIAVMPKGKIFCVSSAKSSSSANYHNYCWDGEKLKRIETEKV